MNVIDLPKIIEGVCNAAIRQSKWDWLYAVPLLHFLRREASPSKALSALSKTPGWGDTNLDVNIASRRQYNDSISYNEDFEKIWKELLEAQAFNLDRLLMATAMKAAPSDCKKANFKNKTKQQQHKQTEMLTRFCFIFDRFFQDRLDCEPRHVCCYSGGAFVWIGTESYVAVSQELPKHHGGARKENRRRSHQSNIWWCPQPAEGLDHPHRYCKQKI